MVACGEPGRGITKVHEPSFGGYGSVYYLDCGDCFTGIYISQNLSMALLIINNFCLLSSTVLSTSTLMQLILYKNL